MAEREAKKKEKAERRAATLKAKEGEDIQRGNQNR